MNFSFLRTSFLFACSIAVVTIAVSCDRGSNPDAATPAQVEPEASAKPDPVAPIAPPVAPVAPDEATALEHPQSEQASGGKLRACESDNDCKVVANYCGGCACDSMLTDIAPTSCKQPVQCLVNPCDGKAAVCRLGKCEVQAGE